MIYRYLQFERYLIGLFMQADERAKLARRDAAIKHPAPYKLQA